LQDNTVHLLLIVLTAMVVGVIVKDIRVTEALVIDHHQGGTEAHPEEHHRGLTGTEGGAEVCHAARLFIETVEGEVATAGVLHAAVRLLLGDQDHVHGQSPGAGVCLGQDQGPHHLSKIVPPLPPHLQSVQVRIGPRLFRTVLTERRV